MGDIINLADIAPKRRSVSQYSTYMSCSEQYRLQRVAGAPQIPAAWFAMGSAVHEVLESWELWGRQGTVEQAQDMYATVYDRMIEEEVEKTGVPIDKWMTGSPKKNGNTDVVERAAKGAEHVLHYIEWANSTADEWRILTIKDQPAVEVEFTLDFNGVQVLGYIDQVVETREGIIYPRDLKTGTRIPSTPFQLAVYAQALEALIDVLPETGSYVMTKNNMASRIEHYEPLHKWSRPILDTMFTNMDQMERLGFYVPEPGDQCRTCGVAAFCRIVGDPEMAAQYQEGLDAPTAA